MYNCLLIVIHNPYQSHGITASIAHAQVLQFKWTVSSWLEQTFNRAWNRCPSLRWTQWLQITGSFMQYDLIMLGIIFSHWVNLRQPLRFHALLIVTILSLNLDPLLFQCPLTSIQHRLIVLQPAIYILIFLDTYMYMLNGHPILFVLLGKVLQFKYLDTLFLK